MKQRYGEITQETNYTPTEGPATIQEYLWILELKETSSQFRRMELMTALAKSRFPMMDIDHMAVDIVLDLSTKAIQAMGKPDVPKGFTDAFE